MNTDKITEKIIGGAYTVSNDLGAGFLEKVYENALYGSSGNCVRDGLGSAKKFRWNYVNKSPFSCLWDPFRVSISEHAL